MLVFHVELLTGRFHGSDRSDRQRAEWPPHPARLFSALVATMHEAGLDGPAERAALEWLEARDPPEILAGSATEPAACTAFVPVNDQASPPERRPRQPRHFPAVTPSSPDLFYIWPDAEPTAAVRAGLSRIAAAVVRLGSSRSFVAVSTSADPPDAAGLDRYVPDAGGDLALRCVAAGHLAELHHVYGLGLRPGPGVLAAYRRWQAPERRQPRTVLAGGAFVAFRFSERPRLPIEATLTVADAVRSTLIALGGDDTPDLVLGQNRHPHCAYVPLPFVGQRHADGHLLGFAVALPAEVPPEARQAVRLLLGRLDRVSMPGGEYPVEAVTADMPYRSNLQERTWSGPSRRWASVTPVLLDRFPRGGTESPDAAAIVARSCAHVGLPAPQAITLSAHSPWAGVPPAHRFRRRRRMADPARPAVHVRLRFAEPVSGPMLLGAGRYFGLGLMRPEPDDGGDAP